MKFKWEWIMLADGVIFLLLGIVAEQRRVANALAEGRELEDGFGSLSIALMAVGTMSLLMFVALLGWRMFKKG